MLAARAYSPVLEMMGGIGGSTKSPDLFVVFMTPALNDRLLVDLPFTIVDEYHHAVRWERWPASR